jgi:hypothetical protein
VFHNHFQRFILSKGREISEKLSTKVESTKERKHFNCCYFLCLYPRDKAGIAWEIPDA